MSCEAQSNTLDEKQDLMEAAEIEAELARRKAKNSVGGAGVLCVGEVVGGFLVGAAVGAIAGGFLCMGGLFAADSEVGEYEAALGKYEIARDNFSDALLAWYSCVSRCKLSPFTS